MARRSFSIALRLSPDVLALNPGLAERNVKAVRLGGQHKSDGLVVNGRRMRSSAELDAYLAIPRLYPGAEDLVYEAFTCLLGPTRYTWDFTFRLGGRAYAVEVKPERWDIHPSGRAALRSIKQASAFYGAHYQFVGMLRQPHGGWIVQTFADGEVVDEARVL